MRRTNWRARPDWSRDGKFFLTDDPLVPFSWAQKTVKDAKAKGHHGHGGAEGSDEGSPA